MLPISIKRLRPEEDGDLPLPQYQTPGSAGLDLTAAIKEPLVLAPGAISLVPTGLAMAIPQGYEGQIRPRSGWAFKYGLTLVNTPGTIDSDYRGEIGLPVINLGPRTVTINRGDRLAQMVINKIERAELILTDDLDDTSRGQGGFGSTKL